MIRYEGNGMDSFKVGEITCILAKGKKGKLFHNSLFIFEDEGYDRPFSLNTDLPK